MQTYLTPELIKSFDDLLVEYPQFGQGDKKIRQLLSTEAQRNGKTTRGLYKMYPGHKIDSNYSPVLTKEKRNETKKIVSKFPHDGLPFTEEKYYYAIGQLLREDEYMMNVIMPKLFDRLVYTVSGTLV